MCLLHRRHELAWPLPTVLKRKVAPIQAWCEHCRRLALEGRFLSFSCDKRDTGCSLIHCILRDLGGHSASNQNMILQIDRVNIVCCPWRLTYQISCCPWPSVLCLARCCCPWASKCSGCAGLKCVSKPIGLFSTGWQREMPLVPLYSLFLGKLKRLVQPYSVCAILSKRGCAWSAALWPQGMWSRV